MIVNVPAPWPGSDEEKAANRLTHSYSHDEDARCYFCDCKTWHVAADYPCGTEPPRMEIERP